MLMRGMAPVIEGMHVQGFTVLQTRFNEKCKTGHCIYIKEHRVKDSDESKPRDRTLMAINVPPYCNEECMKRVFSSCGKVMHVHFHERPTSGPPQKNLSKFFPEYQPIQGFKVAYVIFKSAGSVQKAMSLPYDKPLILSTDEHILHTGMRKWCQQYKDQAINVEELQTEVDEYMKDYDKRLEEEKQKAIEMEGVPDEDGWITVTRHGKNKAAPRTETMEKKVTSRDRKRRKQKELENFYAFQMRDSKRDRIADLRKRFEEDKQRIALMKASRKFRPY